MYVENYPRHSSLEKGVSLCVLQAGQPLPLLSLKSSHQHQIVLSKISQEMILGQICQLSGKVFFYFVVEIVDLSSRIDSFLKTQVFNFLAHAAPLLLHAGFL